MSSDDVDDEIRREQARRKADGGVSLADVGAFDGNLYTSDKFAGFERSIQEEDEDDYRPRASATAAGIEQFKRDIPVGGDDDDPFKDHRPKRIADREDEYHARRRNRMLSPERKDAFAPQTPVGGARSYSEVLQEAQLQREEHEVNLLIKQKMKESKEKEKAEKAEAAADGAAKKRKRWDVPDAAVSDDQDKVRYNFTFFFFSL